MPELIPVEHDPFDPGPRLIPVDHDPFATEDLARAMGRGDTAAVPMLPGIPEGVSIPPLKPLGAQDAESGMWATERGATQGIPQRDQELLDAVRRAGQGDREAQVQVPPQEWRLPDLAALTGMPSALEQGAAAQAARSGDLGRTLGQQTAGEEIDPLAFSFGVGAIKGVGGKGGSVGVEQAAQLAGIKAYHGLPHDFEQFDASMAKPGFYGKGTYFHRAEEDALRHKFSSEFPDEGHMYEADLQFKQPFDMQAPVSAAKAADALDALGMKEQASKIRESGNGYRNGLELWYWGMGQQTPSEAKANALRQVGFDAIIANPNREMTGNTKYSDIINVLDPNIIANIKKYGLAGLIAGGAATVPGAEGNAHLIPVDHDPFASAGIAGVGP